MMKKKKQKKILRVLSTIRKTFIGSYSKRKQICLIIIIIIIILKENKTRKYEIQKLNN